MELSSALTLEMLGKPFLLEKRIVLLHAIKKYGSISKAAKAVPMSYKSAWEAVDMMNSLSPEPIVCRETGGKDGGGTTVTAYGERLLENYALLKEEHGRFLQRLAELTDIENGTFKTMGRLAMQLSARNQIQVEVESICSESLHATLSLRLKGGSRLCAVVTQEAVENLQIQKGEFLTAIFKSSAVCIATPDIPQMNYLEGVVCELEEDKQRVKLAIDIGGHDKVVAVCTKETLQEQISVGSPVRIMIAYSDVILGK